VIYWECRVRNLKKVVVAGSIPAKEMDDEAWAGFDSPAVSMTNHPKRPRDSASLAKLVVDIASGEKPDDSEPMRHIDASAVKRGDARAAALSPARRTAIAKRAAKARWGKKKS
jgi:hypothetical protein